MQSRVSFFMFQTEIILIPTALISGRNLSRSGIKCLEEIVLISTYLVEVLLYLLLEIRGTKDQNGDFRS